MVSVPIFFRKYLVLMVILVQRWCDNWSECLLYPIFFFPFVSQQRICKHCFCRYLLLNLRLCLHCPALCK
uniref:Putative secreted peptide n=1 Tax=Anopheles braziliensis TaxID=58242 RepID=A0A2M3ZVS0_9DIPT